MPKPSVTGRIPEAPTIQRLPPRTAAVREIVQALKEPHQVVYLDVAPLELRLAALLCTEEV